ncbi:serine/threonine protein kinase [Micromonospora craniellae]|uniref:non-specific serine/threonine protein kinase n=1 Tax=Micromonospora craniellae TaxID=2294034 RepID=A0A372FSK1_9ACTN|nr:serine/threonine protein kinase [Micromonospora craniellae]RFS43688.1 serine/threonine protein kinase [Micromonospora craniellae]
MIAGRYRLLDLVGRGGMGTVWRADDELLHRQVAVKQVVLPDRLGGDELDHLRARTLREARTAARLNHPNVVRVYDVVSDAGTPWIVMEYVPSRTLQDVLDADGRLPPHRTARIGLALLDALRAAHDAGVLHRDVKPANVLLAHDGRVLLTDFGLAVFDGDGAMTGAGTILGSPQYVAPERAAEGVSSVPADLWSLGATLYAAVEGRSPYARSTAMATLSALASAPPDPARHAGPLSAALAGLLRREPAHRADHPEARRRLLAAAGPDETPPETGDETAPLPTEPGRGPAAQAGPDEHPHDVEGADRGSHGRGGVARPWALAAVAVLVAMAAGIGTALTVVGTGGDRSDSRHEATDLPPGTAPDEVGAPGPGGPRPRDGRYPPPPPPGGFVPPPLPCVRPWVHGGPIDTATPVADREFRPPAGWAWHTDRSGFRVAIPDGWRYSRDSDVACFQDPTTGRAFSVATGADPSTGPLARLRAVRDRELAAGTLPGYQEFRLGRIGDSTEWEFAWLTPHGDRLRAVQIVPDRPARSGRSWTLGWITREGDWQNAAAPLAIVRASFWHDR